MMMCWSRPLCGFVCVLVVLLCIIDTVDAGKKDNLLDDPKMKNCFKKLQGKRPIAEASVLRTFNTSRKECQAECLRTPPGLEYCLSATWFKFTGQCTHYMDAFEISLVDERAMIYFLRKDSPECILPQKQNKMVEEHSWYILPDANSTCYVVDRTRRTWDAAREYCMAIGASLPVFDSIDQLTMIHEWLRDTYMDENGRKTSESEFPKVCLKESNRVTTLYALPVGLQADASGTWKWLDGREAMPLLKGKGLVDGELAGGVAVMKFGSEKPRFALLKAKFEPMFMTFCQRLDCQKPNGQSFDNGMEDAYDVHLFINNTLIVEHIK